MKKYIFIIILATGAFWLTRTNEYAAWFKTKDFYRPIFTSTFDTSVKGTSVQAHLKEEYTARHGFSLILPYNGEAFENFDNLDGMIEYTFSSSKTVLSSQMIPIPKSPMMNLNNKEWRIYLFTFDLPMKGVEKDLVLKVSLHSPITKLDKYKGIVRCEVAPAYWP